MRTQVAPGVWREDGPVIRGYFPRAELPGPSSDGSGGWQSAAHRARTHLSYRPAAVLRTHPKEVREYIKVSPQRRRARTVEPRACPQCHTVFQPRQTSRKYCSQACGYSSRRRIRRPYRQETSCGHADRSHYSLGRCKVCYYRLVRERRREAA